MFNSWFHVLIVNIILEIGIFIKWYEITFNTNTFPIQNDAIILWVLSA